MILEKPKNFGCSFILLLKWVEEVPQRILSIVLEEVGVHIPHKWLKSCDFVKFMHNFVISS